MIRLSGIAHGFVRKMGLQEVAGEEERLKSPAVNYMGPDKGPFHCGNCMFFESDKGFCKNEQVQASVDKDGCCNLFNNDQ